MKKITLIFFITLCLFLNSCIKSIPVVTPSVPLSDSFVGTYSCSFNEKTTSQYLDQHKLTIKIIKLSSDKLNISYKDDVLYGGKTVHNIYNFELVQVMALSTTELKINENINIYEDNNKKDVVINMIGKGIKNGNSISIIFENAYLSNSSKQALYFTKN